MPEMTRKKSKVMFDPWYREGHVGVYYKSAAVIEADGAMLGKYRKTHIPHVGPCFWEKFYFKPGNLGYPVWDTSVGRVGILICYDRHFPEPARALGLKGAEHVFNPSATVKSLSRLLWQLEQPAHAVANSYWIGASTRDGVEKPLHEAPFYGSGYSRPPGRRVHRESAAP